MHLQGTYTTEGLIDEIRKLFPSNTQVHCAVVMAGPGRRELTPRVHRRDLGDEGLPVSETCEEARDRVRGEVG